MLATVASLTAANRIKRRSNEYGVYSSVIQTPQAISKDGCGYSLRFDGTSKRIIENSAENLGIRIRAFYDEEVIDGKKIYHRI